MMVMTHTHTHLHKIATAIVQYLRVLFFYFLGTGGGQLIHPIQAFCLIFMCFAANSMAVVYP